MELRHSGRKDIVETYLNSSSKETKLLYEEFLVKYQPSDEQLLIFTIGQFHRADCALHEAKRWTMLTSSEKIDLLLKEKTDLRNLKKHLLMETKLFPYDSGRDEEDEVI